MGRLNGPIKECGKLKKRGDWRLRGVESCIKKKKKKLEVYRCPGSTSGRVRSEDPPSWKVEPRNPTAMKRGNKKGPQGGDGSGAQRLNLATEKGPILNSKE